MVPQKPSGQPERIEEIRNGVHKLEAVTVIQKLVRRQQSDRFFAQCHIAASLLSHKAFLPPLRMTIGGKSVIMRETLIVIRSECEGSATMVRESVRYHQGDRFFASCYIAASLFSHKVFLRPLRTTLRKKERQIRLIRVCRFCAVQAKYKEYFIRKKKWTFPVGQYDNII